jgi:hypothetical protein
MDIMRPPLEQQVAPAPWLVARSRVDVPVLIRKSLGIHPNASVDEIVSQLAAWGVQVSGIIISMWMMKWKQEAEQANRDDLPGKAAGNTEDADLYCTCSEQPCGCGRPGPTWWHQYCCCVRVTKQQIKERDRFFEHATT